jgi:hypothetical protein
MISWQCSLETLLRHLPILQWGVCVYVYIYMYMCMCMCICICIYYITYLYCNYHYYRRSDCCYCYCYCYSHCYCCYMSLSSSLLKLVLLLFADTTCWYGLLIYNLLILSIDMFYWYYLLIWLPSWLVCPTIVNMPIIIIPWFLPSLSPNRWIPPIHSSQWESHASWKLLKMAIEIVALPIQNGDLP